MKCGSVMCETQLARKKVESVTYLLSPYARGADGVPTCPDAVVVHFGNAAAKIRSGKKDCTQA